MALKRLSVVLATAILVDGATVGNATANRPTHPTARQQPHGAIALHPDNARYFVWRGRPTLLLTSAEHYGALINLDFDLRRYLDTLAAEGMNYTRIFSGAYVEPEGAFKIARNTLAPLPGRYLAPWARSAQPGYGNGGNKFDLARWDESYFTRLKDFLRYASSRGIVVELTLFCPMYEDLQWRLSPMNDVNNVNGVGRIGRNDVHTLDRNGGLLAIQVALTRKLVTEVNAFDNVFFEICNEPYFGGVTTAWQHHIAEVIVDTERGLPNRHLIAQNIANKSAPVVQPHPAISIFNFHYATPPDAVAANYALGKVIGDDETGFRGTADTPYRTEAWDFVVAGGGLYNNLDYSFAAGQEDGTFAFPASQPGGGGRTLRRQIRILREFIDGFDFVRMKPDDTIIKGASPSGVTARALAQPGTAVAIYVRSDAAAAAAAELRIDIGAGSWQAEWIDTKLGTVARSSTIDGGGVRTLEAPPFETDIALRLRRR